MIMAMDVAPLPGFELKGCHDHKRKASSDTVTGLPGLISVDIFPALHLDGLLS